MCSVKKRFFRPVVQTFKDCTPGDLRIKADIRNFPSIEGKCVSLCTNSAGQVNVFGLYNILYHNCYRQVVLYGLLPIRKLNYSHVDICLNNSTHNSQDEQSPYIQSMKDLCDCRWAWWDTSGPSLCRGWPWPRRPWPWWGRAVRPGGHLAGSCSAWPKKIEYYRSLIIHSNRRERGAANELSGLFSVCPSSPAIANSWQYNFALSIEIGFGW